MKLVNSIVQSISWSSISQFGKQGIQYATTIILASILVPSDFGLMAMAVIFIGFLDLFKDIGLSAAIIQRQHLSTNQLSSIYFTNITVGMIFTFVIFFSSSLIASFYQDQRIETILQVLSSLFFISGFSILQKSLLEKELKFRLIAKIELMGIFIGSIGGISFAITGYGVWSLVFQSILSSLITTILLLKKSDFRPTWYFKFVELKGLMKYSVNLVGYNLFNYFVRNADYLLIGKFLGENQLGNYYLAYKIMLYPVISITQVISRVMFPLYSQIKEDLNIFRNYYLKTTELIAFFTFPLMIGMMILSKYFVNIFFTNSWDTQLLTNLLIVLAPVGLIQSISATTGSIYMATGKTDWMFIWGIVSGIITVTAFVIGLQYGVMGIAISYLIVNCLLIYPVFYAPFKLIKLTFKKFIKNFRHTFTACILMSGLLLLIKAIFLQANSQFISFIILLISAVIIYISFNFNTTKYYLDILSKNFRNNLF